MLDDLKVSDKVDTYNMYTCMLLFHFIHCFNIHFVIENKYNITIQK